jgi:hypothetical protein
MKTSDISLNNKLVIRCTMALWEISAKKSSGSGQASV